LTRKTESERATQILIFPGEGRAQSRRLL
jgi:hypothetical protein